MIADIWVESLNSTRFWALGTVIAYWITKQRVMDVVRFA
jgi:hypothetical protein